jgi:S1-C subfamily serine protease
MNQPHSAVPLRDLSDALTALVAGAAPEIVSVQSGRFRASGFAFAPGLFVTAEEALEEEGEHVITLPGGRNVGARLAGRDPTTDVALLRADGVDLAAATLATPTIAVGALAVAVGAQEGAAIATLGMVSRVGGPWRSLRGGEIAARIELDLRLRGNGEGSLVLDASGGVIGMAVRGPRRRVLVIPSATITRVATVLASRGRVARGYLGLGLQQVAIDRAAGTSGVMVMSVDPAGPGAAAHIHQGDIIVAWNGEPVRQIRALLRALGPDSVGQPLTLGLRRAGEAREAVLTIGERPTS